MENRLVREAIKLALIQAVKKKFSTTTCKVCGDRYHKLYRVAIRGLATVHLCDGCVIELNEFIKKQEYSAFDDIFQTQVNTIIGEPKQVCRIEPDSEDVGSYYGVAKYQEDHNWS